MYRRTLDQVNACVGNVLPLLPFPFAFELCAKYTDCRDPLWSCLKYVGLGSGILFTYPEIATIAGLQGLLVYGLASSLPLLAFGWVTPVIRRKCPEGFVLTEWTRQRYGTIPAIYLSVLTYVI